MSEFADNLTRQEREDRAHDEKLEKAHRPSLQDLRVFKHSGLKYGYQKSHVDCDGMMDVEEAFGLRCVWDKNKKKIKDRYDYGFVSVVCTKCGERVVLDNPLAELRMLKYTVAEWDTLDHKQQASGERQQINF